MFRFVQKATRLRASVLALGVAAALSVAGPQATAAPGPDDTPMNAAFERAAKEYGVPRDLLATVGYSETHLDGHDGRPSQARGYGVMHLVSNPVNHSLDRAAELTGHSPAELRRDTAANIEGGAAVLRAHADALGLDRAERRDIDAWYPAVARYSGAEGAAARLYADAVYAFLAQGIDAMAEGEKVSVARRDVTPDKGAYQESGLRTTSADYPPAGWVPASSSNFSQGRSEPISQIVVHVTQGSYAGTISWFQNPQAEASAHYVVRSSDGEVTQMVRDADTAWHARSANPSSLGIEHEGYVSDPTWFTDSMYRSSAALTRHLADRYGIPKDRAHIVGHAEVPGNDHTDPGPHWNWDYYMQLVGGSGGNPPVAGHPAESGRVVSARSADGRLEVFAAGADGIHHAWQTAVNGAWSDWEPLGGPGDAELAIGPNADGRLELFAINGNVFQHRYQLQPSGGWSGWEDFGGGGRDIAVGANGDGRLEVFASGPVGVFHRWQTAPNAGWSGWESAGGGPANSRVEMEKAPDGRLEVFALNGDTFQHLYQTAVNGGWSGWEEFGGGGHDLTVDHNQDGRLEVFASGPVGVFHKYQTSSTDWSGWEPTGGLADAQLTSERSPDGRVEVFAINGSAAQHLWQTGVNAPYGSWDSFGGGGTEIIAAANADGRIEVFGTSHAGVYHKWQTGPSSWSQWGWLNDGPGPAID
ncbi:N-acetylmuramoyl-L-alanine amidase [Streptomyces sp. KLOTTS4A1]|uniref:N-acetylmuramoyl-L-alanine amidase n=1 Tax=Streptomyces sp. KLOTTS4A1 TaxID=3390996 RepID=UPI0039F5B89C